MEFLRRVATYWRSRSREPRKSSTTGPEHWFLHLSSVIPKVVVYFPMLLEMFCKFTLLDVAVFCSSFAWFLSPESLNSPCLQLKSIESHEGLNVLQVLCFFYLYVIVLKTTYVRSTLPWPWLPVRAGDLVFVEATALHYKLFGGPEVRRMTAWENDVITIWSVILFLA